VTRHDDGKRIPAESLSDRTRQSNIAEASGYVAVGQRLTRRNRARLRIHPLFEIGDGAHVEIDAGQILLVTLE
jgi:hypothetical protein